MKVFFLQIDIAEASGLVSQSEEYIRGKKV